MPGLCGDALLDELGRRVAIPVIVLSGDPSGSNHARASAVVSKPVSSTSLLATVRDVLDRARERHED